MVRWQCPAQAKPDLASLTRQFQHSSPLTPGPSLTCRSAGWRTSWARPCAACRPWCKRACHLRGTVLHAGMRGGGRRLSAGLALLSAFPPTHPYACSVVDGGFASLQAHVERLFVLVLLRQAPGAAAAAAGRGGGGGGSAESAQGVAFLAMLLSLGWAVSWRWLGYWLMRAVNSCAVDAAVVPCMAALALSLLLHQPHLSIPRLPVHPIQVRRLALALVWTFWGEGSPQVAAVERELGDESRWGVDDELLQAAQAVAGLAL